MATYMVARYHEIRLEWIEKLGGECVICSTTEELEFDHIDPDTKEYDIAKIMCHNPEKVAKEMAKCQLLCKKHHKDKTSIDNGVRHGEGLTGKRNCYCPLCKPLKQEYNRQFRKNKMRL